MPTHHTAPYVACLPRPADLTGSLPLQGLTILVVEDSRYASDAMRLMCQRSGARLRRADSLATSRSHLACYRPDVMIIDLGLPDGRGEALIQDLATRTPRPLALLGTSGDPEGGEIALSAGADGFLEKPIDSLAAFQARVLSCIPGMGTSRVTQAVTSVHPDPMALQDDLARAEEMVRDTLHNRPGPLSSWLKGFVTGIARHAGDKALHDAAHRCSTLHDMGLLHGLLRDRLSGPDAAWR